MIKNSLLVLCLVSFFSLAEEMKKPAPNWQLPDIQSSTQVSLTDYKGKVVYLDFWASWCKPCVQSFPFLQGLYEQYQQQGLVVIAINLDEDKNNALAFLEKVPVTYPVLYDSSAKSAFSYQVKAMPSSYFIDKKGNIRAVHLGYKPADNEKIIKAIEHLLAE